MRRLDAGHLGARALILAGLVLTACPPDNGTDFPKRPKPVDAGTPADCAAACDHLRALGCEEGKPTKAGSTCEDVCNHTEASGAVTLNPACVVKIATCDAIEGCTYGAAP